jgi:hypothetical protein
MSARRLLTILAVAPLFFLTSAYAGDAPELPRNPVEAVNWWTLISFIVTWGTFLYGITWTVRKNRATAEKEAARQAKKFFLEELDDPAARKKMADQRELWVHSEDGQRAMIKSLSPTIDKAVDDAVKEHDSMAHAHALALTRYVSTDMFNGGMSRMEALIDGLRTLLASSEQRQAEGIREVKHLIREANEERRRDYHELKRNVAAAFGDRSIISD